MFTKQQQEIVAAPGISAERLVERLAVLEKAYSRLLEAFNTLFDVVAPELGYKAATFPYYVGGGRSVDMLRSPRQLAMTEPVPEIIRTKKAKGA